MAFSPVRALIALPVACVGLTVLASVALIPAVFGAGEHYVQAEECSPMIAAEQAQALVGGIGAAHESIFENQGDDAVVGILTTATRTSGDGAAAIEALAQSITDAVEGYSSGGALGAPVTAVAVKQSSALHCTGTHGDETSAVFSITVDRTLGEGGTRSEAYDYVLTVDSHTGAITRLTLPART